MNKRKLVKQIEKYYYSHGQNLIIDSWEQIEGTEQDCAFDIYLKDSDIFLFTIQNYTNLNDIDIRIHYFPNYSIQRILKWDGVLASYIPLYENQIFTLKTFKPITKDDIVKCTKYFVREILNSLIFNIKFTEKE